MVCLSLNSTRVTFHLSKSTALQSGILTSTRKRTEHGTFAFLTMAAGIFKAKKTICKGLYNRALVCNKNRK